MSKTQYYKAVYKTHRGLESVSKNEDVIGPSRENAVIYKIDQWANPKIPKSALFVFANLESTKVFLSRNFGCYWEESFEIYECQVKNPRKCKALAYDKIEIFWQVVNYFRHKNEAVRLEAIKKIGEYRDCWDIKEPPLDTFICNSVKLIKKVK